MPGSAARGRYEGFGSVVATRERLLRMVMARSPAPSALAPFHDTSATEGPFTSHSLWSTLLAQTRVGSYTHDPDHGTRRAARHRGTRSPEDVSQGRPEARERDRDEDRRPSLRRSARDVAALL